MAGLVAAALAAATKTQAFSELQDNVWRNNEVLQQFETTPWLGGSTWPVKHNYAGNTSVQTYSEGDAPPAAVAQSYITANWPEAHYVASVQITGHTRDYALNGSPAALFFDQIALELQKGLQDAVSKVSKDMLSASQVAPVGILGIVSSTGTIAGLARTTYPWFAALAENGAGTTISLSDLDKAYQEIRDTVSNTGTALPGKPGNPDVIFCSLKQETKIRAAAGLVPGQANNSIRYNVGPDGVPQEIGFKSGQFRYSGCNVVPLRDFSQSHVVMGERGTMKVAICRNWQVDMLAKADDSDKQMLTGAFGLVCTNPRAWKDIANLTAA